MHRTAIAIWLFLSSLAALPASAEPKIGYSWMETSIQFSNLGRAEATATSVGIAVLHTSSQFSSHLSTITLPAGPSLLTTVPVTDPTQAPITAVQFDVRNRTDLQGGGVIGNVSGAVAESGALTPNTIPMTGAVRICPFVHSLPPCEANIPLPFGGTSAGNWIGHGIGGILTIGGTGSLNVSVVGAPYTVLTVSAPARTTGGALVASTAKGFAHGPASLTSSTATPSGVLQIVTANHIRSAGAGAGNQDVAGSITRTLIHVIEVPEPGLGLLLASGSVFVALLGWRRRGSGQ